MQQRTLEFHVRQNDYFGTLATVLDLLRQDLRRRGQKGHDATLADLRDELMYLQRSCRIESTEAARFRQISAIDRGPKEQ